MKVYDSEFAESNIFILKSPDIKEVKKEAVSNGTKYSRMEQIKFMDDSLWKIWRVLLADHTPSNVWRLSSTNFTWSILEYFVPNKLRYLQMECYIYSYESISSPSIFCDILLK